MKVEVVTSYRVYSTSYIDLPIKNVKEIEDYFVKDNILHYALGDEEWKEVELIKDGEEDYEKNTEVKFYSAESHSTVLKVSKSLSVKCRLPLRGSRGFPYGSGGPVIGDSPIPA